MSRFVMLILFCFVAICGGRGFAFPRPACCVVCLVAVVDCIVDCHLVTVELVGGAGGGEGAVVLVHEVFGFVGGDFVVGFVGGLIVRLVDVVVEFDVVGLLHCSFPRSLSGIFVSLVGIYISRFCSWWCHLMLLFIFLS